MKDQNESVNCTRVRQEHHQTPVMPRLMSEGSPRCVLPKLQQKVDEGMLVHVSICAPLLLSFRVSSTELNRP